MIGNNLWHFIRVKLKIDKPHTQTSFAEQELIKKYSSGRKKAVEIGVFEGYNTALIAESLIEEGVLYAIDPFFKGRLGFSYNKLISHKYLKNLGLYNKIVWIEDFSNLAIDKIPDDIDFIFVDGDHSFDGVKKDFELYSQRLSINGLIAFHDARIFEKGWTKENWGPVKLVNEIIIPSKKWSIIAQVDSLIIVKRISQVG